MQSFHCQYIIRRMNSGTDKDFSMNDCSTMPTMTKSSGLVSVVLPVHNGMPHLPTAVKSILNQQHVDLELLIVSDGSDDDATSYLCSLTDPRVRILVIDGCGIVDALNCGLAEAKGIFFARQDADDISHPERLARQAHFLQNHPDIAVVATYADFIDDNANPIDTEWTRAVRRLHDPAISPDQLRALLPLTCCIVHGSVMARTSVLRESGGYRLQFEWAEDYDFWLRLLPAHGFAKLPEQLYTYRIHQAQNTTIRRQSQTNRVIRAKLEYLRRIAPHLDEPVRAIVLGDNPGALLYQQIAPDLGFTTVRCTQITSDRNHHLENGACCIGRRQDWDVVIVTDFGRLEECSQLLSQCPNLRHRQEGNFFIRMNP
jgi:hypothetical protein